MSLSMGLGVSRLLVKCLGFLRRVVWSGSSSDTIAIMMGDSYASASSLANKVSGGLVDVKMKATSALNSTIHSAKIYLEFANNWLQVRALTAMAAAAGAAPAGGMVGLMSKVSLGNGC